MPDQQFDPDFYCAQLVEPLADGVNPWHHFLDVGVHLGYNPAPWFNVSAYLDAYPDVRDDGINPFVHWVLHGQEEGRNPNPINAAMGAAVDEAPMADLSPLAPEAVAAFDTAFYLARYPDVARDGIDPLKHYERFGWRERRDPCAWFSTDYYLSHNADVLAAGVDPFSHYLMAGHREGRRPRDPILGRGQLESRRSIRVIAEEWRRGHTTVKVESRSAFVAALGALVDRGVLRGGGWLVLIGNDDYRVKVGGSQLCVREDVRFADERGLDVAYVMPTQPLPNLAPHVDYPVAVVVNGRDLPVVMMSDAQVALGSLIASTDDDGVKRVVVHGLLGHAPEAIRQMTQSLGARTMDYWAHDYSAACSSYAPMANDFSYCDGPAVASTRCWTCTHGSDRATHTARISELLSAPGITVCCPSSAAEEVWRRTTGLDGTTLVVPHGSVTFTGQRTPRSSGRPVVAFAGTPAWHKGWGFFQEFVRWSLGRDDLDLLVLCEQEPADSLPVRWAKAGGVGGPTMQEALEAHAVDAVFLWSLWPETFALVAYEAIAAGCHIITNPGSGNLEVAAREHDRLLLCNDVDELVNPDRREAFVARVSAAAAQPRGVGTFELTGLTAARMGAR